MNRLCFLHQWRITDQREQPSALELLTASRATRLKSENQEQLAARPVIVARRCARCGIEQVIRV